MFLLKLNFFSHPLCLIITLFQLALITDLHPHLTIWISYLMTSNQLIPPFLSNLMLLGDFNINFHSTSSSRTKLDVISDTFDIVNVPTHLYHTDTTSTIDLVFLPSNIDNPSCSILPPVSSSDLFSILFSLPTDSVNSPSPSPPRKIWLYHPADFERVNALLCSIDWKELLPFSDPDASWAILKELFLRIMTSTVHNKLVYLSTNSYHPWINCSFLNHVKKINSIFSSAKRSGSPSLWAKYHSYRNKTLAYLRHLKTKFFQNLLTSPLPRSFWSAFALNLSPFPPFSIMVLL